MVVDVVRTADAGAFGTPPSAFGDTCPALFATVDEGLHGQCRDQARARPWFFR